MKAKSLLRLGIAPLLALALLAPAASARDVPDVPSPSNSIIPPVLVLSGRAPLGVDPISTFTCEVRGVGGGTIANSLVMLDFTGCPSARFCASQTNPNLLLSCAQGLVSRFTNSQGQATFQLIGAAHGMPGGPCLLAQCLKVYADGVLVRSVQVVTPDLDGVGGLGPNDLSLWLDLMFAGTNCSLADFDGSGDLGPNDLSLWLTWSFAGGSTQSCAVASCP